MGNTYPIVPPGASLLAPSNSVALNGQAVNGSDPRLGVRGGVALVGDAGAASGFGTAANIALSSEFELAFYCRHTAADKRCRTLAAITTSSGPIAINLGHYVIDNTAIGPAFDTNFQAVSSAHVGQWVLVTYGRDSAGWFLSVNGTVCRDDLGVAGTPVSLDRVFGGTFGGYGQFGGDVRSAAIFNRALTESERLALMRGEWTTAMVAAGYAVENTTFALALGNGAIGSATAAGFIASPVSGNCYYTTTLNRTPATGAAVEVEFTATASGLAWVEPGNSGLVPFTAGANRLTLIGSGQSNPRITLQLAQNCTITGFVCRVLGVSGRWEPLDCTTLRWLDSSGNGNDLIYGAGVTPVQPQPKRRRSALVTFTLGTSTFTAPAGWVAAKASTGELRISRPSYAKDGNAAFVTMNDYPGVAVCASDNTYVYVDTYRNSTGAKYDHSGVAEIFWNE